MTRYALFAGLTAMVLGATVAQAETNAQAKERQAIRQQNALRYQAQQPKVNTLNCDGITVKTKRDQCQNQAQEKTTSPLLPVDLREYDQFQRFSK
jgi:hypothetical protein